MFIVLLQTNGLNADTLSRGKRSLAVNLKHGDGVNIVKQICKRADVLIEPFRPGEFQNVSTTICTNSFIGYHSCILVNPHDGVYNLIAD